MLKYSLKRLASSILTLFIIITVIFVLLRQMPIEGYFENFDKLDEVQIQNGLNQLGLNKPIHEQLIDFFANLFRGDLGKSIRYSKGDSISGIIVKPVLPFESMWNLPPLSTVIFIFGSVV